MIDFRYHLVSLVAVFLALAVGIVLGAGPLKEPIGATLTQRVQQLANDRDALSQQLKTAQAGIDSRDTFITQMERDLVADQLGGRSVVLVTLPGADLDTAKPLTQAISDAGGKVTGRIDVQNAWVDPGNRAAREQAVASLKASVGTGDGLVTASPSRATPTPSTGSAGGSSASDAAQLLARAVLTTELSSSEKTDSTEKTVLDGLSRAGLIDVNGDTPGRATQAVLLTPAVAQAVQGAPASPTPTASLDTTSAWVTLAAALDAASTGAVVVGPASSAAAGGVLAAVRGQSQLASTLSTVDTGGTPMGDVTTVFALREQQLGKAGNYGFAEGATAPLPGAG